MENYLNENFGDVKGKNSPEEAIQFNPKGIFRFNPIRCPIQVLTLAAEAIRRPIQVLTLPAEAAIEAIRSFIQVLTLATEAIQPSIQRITIEDVKKHQWFKNLKRKLLEATQVPKENPRLSLQSDEEIEKIVEEAKICLLEDATGMK